VPSSSFATADTPSATPNTQPATADTLSVTSNTLSATVDTSSDPVLCLRHRFFAEDEESELSDSQQQQR